METARFVIGGITVGLLFVAAVIFGVRGAEHNIEVSACSAFGRSSGYEVKWVDFNFWDYDCLGKLENGKWVSTKVLLGVNQ